MKSWLIVVSALLLVGCTPSSPRWYIADCDGGPRRVIAQTYTIDAAANCVTFWGLADDSYGFDYRPRLATLCGCTSIVAEASIVPASPAKEGE